MTLMTLLMGTVHLPSVAATNKYVRFGATRVAGRILLRMKMNISRRFRFMNVPMLFKRVNHIISGMAVIRLWICVAFISRVSFVRAMFRLVRV